MELLVKGKYSAKKKTKTDRAQMCVKWKFPTPIMGMISA